MVQSLSARTHSRLILNLMLNLMALSFSEDDKENYIHAVALIGCLMPIDFFKIIE